MYGVGIIEVESDSSAFHVRHVRSFVRPIRPSWSRGQPVFDQHFNAGHPFAELANFGPELVNFSFDTSNIFAHIVAGITGLAANAVIKLINRSQLHGHHGGKSDDACRDNDCL